MSISLYNSCLGKFQNKWTSAVKQTQKKEGKEKEYKILEREEFDFQGYHIVQFSIFNNNKKIKALQRNKRIWLIQRSK